MENTTQAFEHLKEMLELKFQNLENHLNDLFKKLENEKARVDEIATKVVDLDKRIDILTTRLQTGWVAVLIVSSAIGFLINLILK